MTFESKYLPIELFLRRISGLEKDVLLVDHNYVKAWNAHPESHRTKPAHLLFMKGLQRYPQSEINADEDIDIETWDEPVISPFDNPKLRMMPTECERNIRHTQLFKETEQEEFDLSKCSTSQQKLYKQVMNVLYDDKLAKLSCAGNANEPLKRRLAVSKAGRQLRQAFGLIFWNMDLLSWLHKTLINNLDVATLSLYIDAMQTLKSRMPTLIDRVLQSCAGTIEGDAIIQIFRKSWDPVTAMLNQNKPKKLPGNSIILICPGAPNQGQYYSISPRMRFWQNHLSSMCKVINLATLAGYIDGARNYSTFDESLDYLMNCIRSKVNDLKNHYPDRPLILMGWTLGALLISYIALREPVDGLICLGYPLTGVNGSRGDLNDPLLDNNVPTLFAVGQNALMCSTDDMEDFRARMRAETGLVVVGGADDLLRMCPEKMKAEGVTQNIVDRCLIDEISEFVSSVIVKLPSTSGSTNATGVPSKPCTPIQEENDEDLWTPEEEGKRKRRKPREYSPELSPVRKRQKHHLARQSTSESKKSRLSPLSSESSSSGSINEKTTPTKSAKKSSEKRIRRPSSGSWRKRPGRPVSNPTSAEISPKKILHFTNEELKSSSTSTANPEPKIILPFSKSILPKKNDEVDVTAAFGSDSSFLPRPLTPPEPEDTVSAEETERALAELENNAEGKLAEPQSPSLNTSWVGDALSDKAMPVSETLSETHVETTVQPTIVSISPPTPTVEEKSTVTLTPTLHSILSQGKITPTALQTLKNSGGISLLTNNQVSPTKSTIITLPSSAISSSTSLLMSNSGLRTASGKVIQLIAKNTAPRVPEKEPCNLSLLSDVAGMSQHMPGAPARRIEPAPSTSSTATLVKLDRPSPFQSMKCLKVIRAPSPPSRIETAEEMVEKQLAIQALNKSIGIESSSSLVKESGYSICYAKADGSIVSRSVTRPNYAGIAPRMPMSQARGRARPPFPGHSFRFGQR